MFHYQKASATMLQCNGEKKLKTISRLVFHQSCLIHKYVPHFDSLILSNTFLYDFLLVYWLATLAFMFAAIHLFINLFCFCIFKSSILVLLQKFCLVVFIWLILSVVHIYQLTRVYTENSRFSI